MGTKKKKPKKLTLLLILGPEIQCLYYQLNVVSATPKDSLLVEDKKNNDHNNNNNNIHQHSFYMSVSILYLARKKS